MGVAIGVLGVGGMALGGGPGPSLGDADATTEPFPTATDGGISGADEGSSVDGSTTSTPVDQPFAVVIDGVEECGTTCRDVTVSLTNQQAEPAGDVVVYSRVFAGNSTAGSDLVYRGEESVGTLGAGETYTTTERVELSYGDAYAIDQADGWVTIQTTVETADRTVTFTERRDVT